MAAEKIVTESALAALASDVKRAIYDVLPGGSASGDVATFDTDIAVPLKSLIANITAKQDLHGYDHPWPAGGGKNLFDNSNFPSGYGAVVATYNPDGTVKLNGTASGNEYFSIPIDLPNSNYVLSVGNTSSNANVHVSFVNHNSEFYGDNDLSTTSKVVNISGDLSAIVFYVLSGTTLTDFTIKPMLELGSTATAYEPYSNICPIVRYSELNLTRCGVNLFDKSTIIVGFWIKPDGTADYSPVRIYSDLIRIKPNTQYYITNTIGGYDFFSTIHYDSNLNIIGEKNVGGSGDVAGTITSYNESAYMRINSFLADLDTLMVSEGNTATEYAPYNGQTATVNFGQTVYSGVYDKSGRLTITWGAVDLGALEWFYNSGLQIFYTYIDLTNNVPIKANGLENVKCSIYQPTTHEYTEMLDGEMRGTDDSAGFNIKDLRYSDTATFKTAMSGLILAYELATPIVIDVSELSVDTIVGVNNVFADTGEVAVEYRESVEKYVTEHGVCTHT